MWRVTQDGHMNPDMEANQYQLITMANKNFGYPLKAAKTFHDVVTLTVMENFSSRGGHTGFFRTEGGPN